jgi:hypothetical protein
MKELINSKSFQNAMKQVVAVLTKKWYDLEFFDREDRVWFYIVKK